MILKENITFGNCQCENREFIQDIIYKDSVIGVLIQSERNFLSTIQEKYQFKVKKVNIPSDFNYIESEDSNWGFVISTTLSEFVQKVNKIKEIETMGDKGGQMSKTMFVIQAYRYGDKEKHSYVVGIFDSIEKAIKASEAENQFRGGKYECEIYEFELNNTGEEYCEIKN